MSAQLCIGCPFLSASYSMQHLTSKSSFHLDVEQKGKGSSLLIWRSTTKTNALFLSSTPEHPESVFLPANLYHFQTKEEFSFTSSYTTMNKWRKIDKRQSLKSCGRLPFHSTFLLMVYDKNWEHECSIWKQTLLPYRGNSQTFYKKEKRIIQV